MPYRHPMFVRVALNVDELLRPDITEERS